MDAWMDEPGARVEGHRGAVVSDSRTVRVACTCGQEFAAQPSVSAACLALVQHLRVAVRSGAQVLAGGDGDGLAGVREPRRPVPSTGSGSMQLDIP